MNAIEKAVGPMRKDAVDAAAAYAHKVAADVETKLQAGGWDLNVVAPYPKTFGVSRKDYHVQLSRRKMIEYLTTEVGRRITMQEPDIREMSVEKILNFVEAAKKDAGYQYDAYIAKLNSKIGEVKSAEIVGNSVWGHSILTVEKVDGTTERWKTQMILNVSKLGKIFNQFPTRKVK